MSLRPSASWTLYHLSFFVYHHCLRFCEARIGHFQMRLNILLAFLAAFVAAVQAQNALEALASHMPKCAVRCCYNSRTSIADLTCLYSWNVLRKSFPSLLVRQTSLQSACVPMTHSMLQWLSAQRRHALYTSSCVSHPGHIRLVYQATDIDNRNEECEQPGLRSACSLQRQYVPCCWLCRMYPGYIGLRPKDVCQYRQKRPPSIMGWPHNGSRALSCHTSRRIWSLP